MSRTTEGAAKAGPKLNRSDPDVVLRALQKLLNRKRLDVLLALTEGPLTRAQIFDRVGRGGSTEELSGPLAVLRRELGIIEANTRSRRTTYQLRRPKAVHLLRELLEELSDGQVNLPAAAHDLQPLDRRVLKVLRESGAPMMASDLGRAVRALEPRLGASLSRLKRANLIDETYIKTTKVGHRWHYRVSR